ncbi:NAD(+)/NADH kinase [Haliangium sp.]|uniref:NAD(+)/NADH kinase n=1 Tax=Haliangium sp. TaxID=2663208 RepID=UPI003D0B973D
MKRVGFILKPDGEGAAFLAELVSWLSARGHKGVIAAEDQIAVDEAVIVPRDQMGKEIDLAVVLGGDGTMLAAASLVADHGVPVLGINLGRLGFLTPFDPEVAYDAVDAALAGRLSTSERMRLAVNYIPERDPPVSLICLNDAVIHQGSMARLIEVEVTLDGELVSHYRADGLILSTPTGSTAYNLAAGGPIIAPGLRAVALTPISAHSLTSRPLVVPGRSVVRVTLDGDSRGVVLTVDGRWAHTVHPGDRVEVAAADQPLILFNSDKHYFDILREKLHWGARSYRTLQRPNRPRGDAEPGTESELEPEG